MASIHNLKFYLGLMASMRAALDAGRFAPWSHDFLQRYEAAGHD